MKQNYQQYENFIIEQKAFFETILTSEANEGREIPLTWQDNKWMFNGTEKGFLAQCKQVLGFDFISLKILKGIYNQGEDITSVPVQYIDKNVTSKLNIDATYTEFVKAYCTSLFQNKTPSVAVVQEQLILLKRVYIRMILRRVAKHPVNITSELLQEATDLSAKNRSGKSALSNASKDYDIAFVIARNLNYFGFTFTQIDIEKMKERPVTTAYTTDSKKRNAKAKGKEYEDDKNLSIQTFLNLIVARHKVETLAEKILLNTVLLLLVTGFRRNEVAMIGYRDFKVVEIENPKTKREMEKRGLPTHFVGIKYQGEKKAGQRIHWIEPLAVDIVDSLLVDTLVLTEKLRKHTEYVRSIGFTSWLPKKFADKIDLNKINLHPKTVDLDELVGEIYYSHSKTAISRGRAGQRDCLVKKLQKFEIHPCNDQLNQKTSWGNEKEKLYLISDIHNFLHASLNDDAISKDFIYRYIDSATKAITATKYEDLLFIFPLGGDKIIKAGSIPVIPQIFDKESCEKFLGYGSVGGLGKSSVFSKYNLREENGEITYMKSHTPRHGINTFFALAGVSDHMMAMFMGRWDVSQNKHYIHRSLEERAISTSLVTASNTEQKSLESTALETVKKNMAIKYNTNITTRNALAQPLHTHTTAKDRVEFITDMTDRSDSKLFEEFDEVFDLMNNDEENRKKEMVKPHSDLFVMKLGSCMRKLHSFQCPYDMKCQDGMPCPYFTLTGRSDEHLKIETLSQSIESQISLIMRKKLKRDMGESECNELLEELKLRQDNVRYHLGQSHLLENEKELLELDALDNNQKPKMLSSLFALEQRRLEKLNNN